MLLGENNDLHWSKFFLLPLIPESGGELTRRRVYSAELSVEA